jgi:hypothetical protein
MWKKDYRQSRSGCRALQFNFSSDRQQTVFLFAQSSINTFILRLLGGGGNFVHPHIILIYRQPSFTLYTDKLSIFFPIFNSTCEYTYPRACGSSGSVERGERKDWGVSG